MGLSTFDETFPISWNYYIQDTGSYPGHELDKNGFGLVRFDAIILTNDDSIDHVVRLAADWGNGQMVMGQVNVPSMTGFGAGNAIELLAAVLPTNVTGLVVRNGAGVYVAISEDVVTGGVHVFVQGGVV